MFVAPDSNVDAAKFHAEEIQRAAQRNQHAETKMLTRVRLILRRVQGRQNPPASPKGLERATHCLEGLFAQRVGQPIHR